MVIPVGEGDVQQMKLIVRSSEDEFKESTYGEFKFVPMLKNINNWKSVIFNLLIKPFVIVKYRLFKYKKLIFVLCFLLV